MTACIPYLAHEQNVFSNLTRTRRQQVTSSRRVHIVQVKGVGEVIWPQPLAKQGPTASAT